MEGLTLTTREQTRLQILNTVIGKRCSVREAAEVLAVSERHTWRLLAAYRKEGAAALAHGNRGRVPHNATPAMTRRQVVNMAQGAYAGVNHTHLTELLAEREGTTLSRSTVRRLLARAGISSPRHRRPPRHRCRRMRMPQEGMLVQIDGSHHRWLEERGSWLTLYLAIDDATGAAPYALFGKQEDTEGYFRLMRGIVERYGIPLALYSDRYFVLQQNGVKTEEASLHAKSNPTQFGRAMRQLGVTQVFARSPEAKGRIERANGTFQDRLVSELRLAGVDTLEEANRVLQGFLPRFNARFRVPPADPEPAYRPLDPGLDIDGVLCVKERRKVAKDNTVQYHGRTLQLFPGVDRTSYARARVEVQERLDGQLVVCYRGKVLTPGEAPALAASLRANAVPVPQDESLADLEPDSVEKGAPDNSPKLPKAQPGKIGYEDSAILQLHRELVKAGMERARQQGKHIGRPRLMDRPEFAQRFSVIVERIDAGSLSRRKAARELDIGYASLKRFLDARTQTSEPIADELSQAELPHAVAMGTADPKCYTDKVAEH